MLLKCCIFSVNSYPLQICQTAAQKRCRRHMLEADEFMSSNPENILTDPISISTAYMKMKNLCINIGKEILADIKINNQHILPRYWEFRLYGCFRRMLQFPDTSLAFSLMSSVQLTCQRSPLPFIALNCPRGWKGSLQHVLHLALCLMWINFWLQPLILRGILKHGN